MKNKSSKRVSRPEAKEALEQPFDEEGYLVANQDVLIAINTGLFKSARQHYEQYGRAEGRGFVKADDVNILEPLPKQPQPAPQPITPVEVLPSAQPSPSSSTAAHSQAVPVVSDLPPQAVQGSVVVSESFTYTIESVIVSRSGYVFVVGWVDDAASRLNGLTLRWRNGVSETMDIHHIARIRRRDVEAALGSSRPHSYGFWAFVATGRIIPGQECEVSVRLENSTRQSSAQRVRQLDDIELLNLMLGYLQGADYYGNKQVEGIASIERALGREIVLFHKTITRAICASPYIESPSKGKRKLKGSIIVCLYGRAEYMFVQSALFSGLPGIQDYEFVYVSNSPELSEQLVREIKITNRIYGIEQTLVLLPGNAGFGAANNLAARYAHSNRIMIVNPDVFPHDLDWAKKHTNLVAALPKRQTTLFGVPLYYDDGSLMHGGMYLEMDTAVMFDGKSFVKRQMARVEHYGKGAPATYAQFRASRPVPAVTGAFMSVDRDWFERLGGFTEDFVFGHYEDADLCLKSLIEGVPSWVHDIKLWHLEGKGSTRLPMHEGGSLVNRWLFSATWGEQIIQDGLCGPHPTSPLLENKAAPDVSNAVSAPVIPQTLEVPAPSRDARKKSTIRQSQ